MEVIKCCQELRSKVSCCLYRQGRVHSYPACPSSSFTATLLLLLLLLLLPPPQVSIQVPSIGRIHHQIHIVLVLKQITYTHNIGMAKACMQSDLRDHTCCHACCTCFCLGQDLNSHDAATARDDDGNMRGEERRRRLQKKR